MFDNLLPRSNKADSITSTPGQGSCFTITLPYVKSHSIPPISAIEPTQIESIEPPSSEPLAVESIESPQVDPRSQLISESWNLYEQRVPTEVTELLPLTASTAAPSIVRLEEPVTPAADRSQRQKPLILLSEDNKSNISTFSLYLTTTAEVPILSEAG